MSFEVTGGFGWKLIHPPFEYSRKEWGWFRQGFPWKKVCVSPKG